MKDKAREDQMLRLSLMQCKKSEPIMSCHDSMTHEPMTHDMHVYTFVRIHTNQ